jgi:hypothetical protein
MAPALAGTRLDAQWGAAGEYWRIAGFSDGMAKQQFELLCGLAGSLLEQVFTREVDAERELLAERDPQVRWYRLLKRASPSFGDYGYGEQFHDDGSSAGLIFTGSLSRIAEAAANLCLSLHASHPLPPANKQQGELQMPFSRLMTDKVDVLKADGTKIADRKASVQRDAVFMDASGLLVEPNDLIVRRMSNGAEETYRVIDPGFHEALHGIKAHYQMEVQKLGLPEARTAVQSITFNVSGHNARINQNSTDNSTNIVQVDARAFQHIEALRSELARAELTAEQRVAARELVDEVEEAFRNGKAKKSIVSALLNSLPHIANIASIVSSIVNLL